VITANLCKIISKNDDFVGNMQNKNDDFAENPIDKNDDFVYTKRKR
jgi:hypothetical protein